MAKQYEIILINGKDYPCRFGMAALMDYTKLTNKKINDLGNLGMDMTIEDAIALCWSGLKDGARKAKKPFELEPFDVADLIDEDEAAIEKIMAVFANQYNVDEPKKGNVKGSKRAPKTK
jgi:hypothetical protein